MSGPQSLAGTLRYVRRGAPVELPMWAVVTHLFNHETHHRGQITTLLMQAGQDPGVTDLVAMLNEASSLPERIAEKTRP